MLCFIIHLFSLFIEFIGVNFLEKQPISEVLDPLTPTPVPSISS